MRNRRTPSSPVERIAERNLCDDCERRREREFLGICQFRNCTERELDESGVCLGHALHAAAVIQTTPGPWAPVYAPPPPPPIVTPAVYYVRLHGFIKIGTTVNLRQRMKSFLVEDSDLLAVEPGGATVEQRRHQQFRHLLRRGRELFEVAPELDDHIAQVRQMFGDPIAFLAA